MFHHVFSEKGYGLHEGMSPSPIFPGSIVGQQPHRAMRPKMHPDTTLQFKVQLILRHRSKMGKLPSKPEEKGKPMGKHMDALRKNRCFCWETSIAEMLIDGHFDQHDKFDWPEASILADFCRLTSHLHWLSFMNDLTQMHLSRSVLYPEIPTFMGEKTIILRKFNFVHTKSLCLLVLTDIMNMGGPKYQLLFGGQIQFSNKPTIISYQVTWLICTIHIR